jgi:hypothetical protein
LVKGLYRLYRSLLRESNLTIDDVREHGYEIFERDSIITFTFEIKLKEGKRIPTGFTQVEQPE